MYTRRSLCCIIITSKGITFIIHLCKIHIDLDVVTLINDRQRETLLMFFYVQPLQVDI